MLLQTSSGLQIKKPSQGVTTWYPQSDGMSEGSTDGERFSCWGTSWVCNLATALVGMFVPVLLNRRVKGSFPALERNGLGQLVSLQINFLILQEKSCIFHVAFQEHFHKHIPQKGHLGVKHLRCRYFPVSQWLVALRATSRSCRNSKSVAVKGLTQW